LNSRVDICRTFVCAIWAIWTAKNQWIHECHKRSRAETVKFIIQYLQDLKDINQKHLALSPEAVMWRPLEQGFYKINFDAGVDIKKYRSCSGVTAVIMGRGLGLKHVEIEGDSLTVIKKVQNTSRDKSAIEPYIQDIKELTTVFYDCKFKHRRSIGDGVEVHIKTKPLKGYVEYDKIVNRFQSIDLLQKLLVCEAYIFIRVF
ncbi:hypothetical protein Goari_022293, partial [Gossypium aridum]|nr:hypothetical protein [Gossypium aridum]